MKPAELEKISQACVDWYWQFGRQRKGTFEVPSGTWLDAVLRIRNRAAALQRAGENPKPCMALWGPSQTGKSTLLSGYLDDPTDAIGERSALKWHDAEPVRFVAGAQKKNVLLLNPYNQRSDASGCVSRFILSESVPDPEHPVEVTLATEAQIVHALAVGYESECQEKNARNEITMWDADSFGTLVQKFRAAGPPLPEAYEKLHALAETIDLLILSQQGDRGRYANLQHQWEKTLRPLLLSSPGLLSSLTAVREFTAEFFWDAWPSLTQLHERLAGKRAEVLKLWGSAIVRCNYAVATLLLDIDAYKQVREAGSTDISYRSTDDSVPLARGTGQRLFVSADDFGYFQGLVWELRIPLRADVLARRAPVLHAFLQKSDLLDFPGVANAYGSAEKRTNEQIAGNLEIGLTEVLKRGKTASIVVSRARSLDIDGFSLLMKVSNFPAQPKQLNTGIKSWLHGFKQPWPPQNRAMPLNLVLTFFAEMINETRAAGVRKGLEAPFKRLEQLGALSDPKAITLFATTYPQFDLGEIRGTAEEKAAVMREIREDAAVRKHFSENMETLDEMAANGGTDYFFKKLLGQAENSRRGSLLAQRLADDEAQLLQLMQEQIPSDSAPLEERRRVLDAWRDGMLALLQAPASDDPRDPDPAARLSRHLRRLLNIDPDDLEDIPQKAIPTRVPIRAFIDKQFRDWKARRVGQGTFSEAGLTDATHAQKALSYLVEATSHAAIEDSFRADLGHISARSDAKNARRFLAVKMSREMIQGARDGDPGHPPLTEVRDLLETMAQNEERQSAPAEASPHYRAVIHPLLQRLEQIKKTGAGTRPSQPGDPEISALLQTARSSTP